MRKLHVGTSPLTNRIYAGHMLKDGCTWGEGKQDVTGATCGAVCEHVLANGEPVVVSCNGKPRYEITVRELKLNPGEPCHHPGCISHVTHPCEGCGRIAGQEIKP